MVLRLDDEVWQDFFTDHLTRRALESSEVWRNYSRTELARDALREKRAAEEVIDNENQLLADIEAFRTRVAQSPKLKGYLQKVAKFLEENPEMKSKVNESFLNGLELLDLEDK